MENLLDGLGGSGMEFFDAQLQKFLNWCMSKMGAILLALLCIWIGFKLVRLIVKGLDAWYAKVNVDPTVRSFLGSIIKILLYVVVLITAISIMGIEVTSFVTLLGTAGVTVGLALQGSLSNLAGGVLILILKPFVIGDYIKEDTHGNEGTVISIDIFYTRIRTFDGKEVVIPNGTLSNNSLTNLTKQNMRRVDLVVPVEYEADLRKVKETLHGIIAAEEKIIKDQPVDVALDSFGDSALNVIVHVWVATEHYWTVKWSLSEQIIESFREQDIQIPFNQLDVHMVEPKA